MKVKVLVIYRQKGYGKWEEDNPDADYPNEVYREGSWTSKLHITETELKTIDDVRKLLNSGDGDEDYSLSLHMILDEKDNILYNYSDPKSTINNADRFGEHLMQRVCFENKIPLCPGCNETEILKDHDLCGDCLNQKKGYKEYEEYMYG